MKNSGIFKSLSQKQKLLFIGLGSVILILVVVLVALILNDESEKKKGYQPVVDPVSGETMWDINEEPEIGDELVMVGFSQISDYGYMKAQYDKIISLIKEYIEKQYPNSKTANYKKGSFRYLDEKMYKAGFEFVLDNETWIKVTVDTGGSLSDISVDINKE